MENKIADATMQLQSGPMAVLTMLANLEPNFAPWHEQHGHYAFRSETFAFYNCRERGFSLSVHLNHYPEMKDRNPINFVVVEHRNSDDVRVYQWEGVAPMNGVTVADVPELAWQKSIGFPWGQIGEVVDHIYQTLEKIIEPIKLAREAGEA